MTNKPADVRAEDALLSGSLCGWLSCSAAGHFYPQVLLGDRSILTTRVFWGNDGARKWNLPICNLLSALRTVVMWVNEREGCYANVSSGHLAETFQYLLGPAWRSRHRSELQIHHWDRRSCCPVFWCSFFFWLSLLETNWSKNILKLLLQQYRRLDIIVLNVFWELMELTNEMFRTLNYHHCYTPYCHHMDPYRRKMLLKWPVVWFSQFAWHERRHFHLKSDTWVL